ncbi:MAG: hypothetical protein L0312_13730, partial [Acidobacteria bacterium]|nr:hypothetical protein [Acidobacteriota bacterium]
FNLPSTLLRAWHRWALRYEERLALPGCIWMLSILLHLQISGAFSTRDFLLASKSRLLVTPGVRQLAQRLH